jgi:cation diffusion facilitator CzcD-associated flavoprotein CzcO
VINRVYRWFFFWFGEILFAFLFSRSDTWIKRKAREQVANDMKKLIHDPILKNKLIPTYEPFQKRITPSDEYLQTFNRPNVSLITDTIQSVTFNEIITHNEMTTLTQSYEVDRIILATGFSPLRSITSLNPTAPHPEHRAVSLAEVWGDTPGGLYGITVPHMPNYFMMLGPGTVLGHNSVLYMIECQANYIASSIESIVVKGKKSLCLKSNVYENYKKWAAAKMENVIYADGKGHLSWYYNKDGVNWVLWPSNLTEYWWATRSCSMSDYDVK